TLRKTKWCAAESGSIHERIYPDKNGSRLCGASQARCTASGTRIARVTAPLILRQLVIPLADAVQAQRKPDALFGGLEDNESRGLGGAELAEQFFVHHHFGDAAIGQASDKTGAADVDIIEFQAEAGGQQ